MPLNLKDDAFICKLQSFIRISVKALAGLMSIVIALGIINIIYTIYTRITNSEEFLLGTQGLFDTFDAFMTVLIAIEIFVNIVIYLKKEVIQVKIVIATALIAIARKVIVLDFKDISSEYIWAMAGIIGALSLAYWIIAKHVNKETED